MRRRSSEVFDLLSPPLILLTPFISFIDHNDYSYTTPELWICVAGLIALGLLCGVVMMLGGTWLRVLGTAGLLTLVVDLQFDWFDWYNPWPEVRVLGVFSIALALSWATRQHLSRIVTAVFATMLVSTVVLGIVADATAPASSEVAVEDPGPPPDSLPTFVHLILDEHIGIEGIPKDVPNGKEMRRFLRDFFDRYGFRVFGRAYSHYDNTYNAIPNIVNFSSEPVDAALTAGVEPYVVTRNKYFELLDQAGYDIHVYQSTYMDFCARSKQHVVQCQQRDSSGIKAIESMEVALAQKVTLIYRIYARLSALLATIGGYYKRLRDTLRSAGWTLTGWWFTDARLGPVPVMPLFDRVAADVARSLPGDMFFVYLGIPHYPYVYDAMCDLRPVETWEERANPEPMPANDRESRARRYGLYLDQMRCLYRKMDALFQAWQEAGIFDRLLVVMHGDHGSKIYERRPRAENQGKLTHTDYVDGFSTLFAVKGLGYPAGYDPRIAPVEHLLKELAGRQTGHDLTSTEQAPYVFLQGDFGEPMIRQPMPAFGDGL